MDANLLASMVDRHGAALTLYAKQWIASPDDIVQEAFIKLSLLRTAPDHIAPWLYRVVRNGAISAARSEQRRKRHETQAGNAQPSWFEANDVTELDASAIVVLLQKLPLEQREIISLHLWGKLSFAEIGEVMSCSASSAHRGYQAGLESLRRRLLPCPQE